MILIFDAGEIGRRYNSEWVVLDRSLRVRDHGPELKSLRERYGANHTYYLAPGGPERAGDSLGPRPPGTGAGPLQSLQETRGFPVEGLRVLQAREMTRGGEHRETGLGEAGGQGLRR